ncbi:MAG: SPOR domain-containing protein [Phycisphaeraceae bacterium]|nr:MAG: SPOR domain-containing protein [Phycisphaeraceae bacterium]
MMTRNSMVLASVCGVVVLCAGLVAPGCGGGGGRAGGVQTTAPAPVHEDDFRGLFDRGEYNRAYASASRQYPALSGSAKDQAALVAGMSASRVERREDAERWLRPLVDHPSSGVSGSASATLGMDAHRTGRHAAAIPLLTRASKSLTGDDSARASFYAADSLQALGRDADARAMYQAASSSVKDDASLKSKIAARLQTMGNVNPDPVAGAGSYTIQVGAYADFARAMEVRAKLQSRASSAGLPDPRVVTITRDGKTLHAVRVGRFANRPTAEGAQRRFGVESLVMVASGE